MLLVEGNGVGLGYWERGVGAGGDGMAYGYLGGKTYDLDTDVGGDEFGDGGVDVVWVT